VRTNGSCALWEKSLTENRPNALSADTEQSDENKKFNSVVPLKFEHPEQAIEKLLLFYEAAQRLNVIYSTLPTVVSLPAKFVIKARPDVAPGPLRCQDIFENAEQGTGTVIFPNLPEQQFELLALRFRPFMLVGDDTHFLTILHLLARHNEG
jgi:hypothetical protein